MRNLSKNSIKRLKRIQKESPYGVSPLIKALPTLQWVLNIQQAEDEYKNRLRKN